MAKCWIYNELADIPDEFIVINKTEDSMFSDVKRILKKKRWITDSNENCQPKE